jgi:hypothetical protein
VLIICGVSFYFHKKCSKLQQQIDELNSKLEKLDGNSYISSLKRQEQFEIQTVQQINKIYSILNNMNNVSNVSNVSNTENTNNFKPIYNEPVRENYNHIQQESQVNKQGLSSNKSQPSLLNGLSNGLSMLSSLPLSTMFQVVMKEKPPHPNELFQNIDINKELNKKIVEVEDEEDIDTDKLDDELKDELDDLKSNITTAVNTPILTPSLTPSQSSMSNLNLCEDGACKLDINKENYSEKEVNLNIPLNNTQLSDTSDNEKSSPLRYISNLPQNKRGRPKKQ